MHGEREGTAAVHGSSAAHAKPAMYQDLDCKWRSHACFGQRQHNTLPLHPPGRLYRLRGLASHGRQHTPSLLDLPVVEQWLKTIKCKVELVRLAIMAKGQVRVR